ncbi:subtilisin-like serine protease-like protein PR1A [Cucurbitaria berberidis CBS 394.84]|uniref:Subtilisin-like serine protease-like protein PR1A n=1 Tax=Cucurbitaria berberidis CBS 394.84 TaxID=1168544 RepID=A0A9P4GFF4_9PLEO|nr:subtilisin-like serine protease-like protein PR1A [Cucurbitaria berberidis CBS 394.84]KAF1845068.1 subtilisin-like serine protease-like protein PR1A [Cucurbitaria berberidis CBS 394.84]
MQLSLILALLPLALAAPAPAPEPAPVILPRAGSAIPGRYIIKMKNENLDKSVNSALKHLRKGPRHVYKFGNFGGFAADLTDETLDTLRHLPGVDYIEQDAIVKANLGTVDHLEKKAYVTQASSTWGLARISHIARGSTSYTYDSTAGANTCAYVIDTGISTTHPEFEGRAVFLANFAGDGTNTDGNGHGTHVAGTIGSKTYGVAKKTKLYAVKVLDASGSGTNSGVIAGINYVANDAKTRSCPNGAVANMSLGGSKSTAVNSAAANVVSSGVFLAVAAGNSAADASTFSPASEPTAYTVGATDSSDRFASFSNFGTAVDILAPGVAILSTWLNGGTNSISGTSMASPHVAGLGAYLLGFEGKKTPAALSARITALSNKNKITGLPAGTKNYLAFNGNPSG